MCVPCELTEGAAERYSVAYRFFAVRHHNKSGSKFSLSTMGRYASIAISASETSHPIRSVLAIGPHQRHEPMTIRHCYVDFYADFSMRYHIKHWWRVGANYNGRRR